jgi:hypothetical protein
MVFRTSEMRELTLEMIRCTAVAIVDGDVFDFADSSKHLRRGTGKFDLLRAPLDA